MRKELDLPTVIMVTACAIGGGLPMIYAEASYTKRLTMLVVPIALGLVISLAVSRVGTVRQAAEKARPWLGIAAVGLLAGSIVTFLPTLSVIRNAPLSILLLGVFLCGMVVAFFQNWLAFRFQVVKAEATPLPYSLVDNLSLDQIVFPGHPDGREVKVGDATCGGRPMRAVWAHPPVAGDTVIRYRVKTSPGGRYLLYFSIGIRDGAQMGPHNQVEFTVRVDGGEVFRERISATEWHCRLPRPGRPLVASGEFMTIELATNALGNNGYNWAVWGEPMLVEALSPPR